MFGSHLGEIAALGTAFCWTISGIAFEAAGRRIGSLSLNGIRLGMALVLLAIYGAITRGAVFPAGASGHAWLWLSISGLVGFTLGDLCLFRAYVLIGSRLSLLILSLVPPMSALVGWVVLGEVLAARSWIWMAVTLAGVVLGASERRADREPAATKAHPLGVTLAVLGALGQAVGLILSKLGMGDYDPFAATQIRVAAGLVGFALVYTATDWWPRIPTALRDRRGLGQAGLGAFFGPFLGVALSLTAVQHTQAGIAATIMAIVPVLILAPAALFLGERPTPRGVLGALVAVGGVTGLVLD